MVVATLEQIQNSEFYRVAGKNWLNSAIKNSEGLVLEIYQSISTNSLSLSILERLNYLESYLWPNFSIDSNDAHVVSIALIIHHKQNQENYNDHSVWLHFETQFPENFPIFFRRMLSLVLESSVRNSRQLLSLPIRSILISVIHHAFESLNQALVRKEVAPLVSISVFNSLCSESALEEQLSAHPQLAKLWKSSLKKFEKSKTDTVKRGNIIFERGWVSTIVLEFLSLINDSDESSREDSKHLENYTINIITLLITILSQLPTRRYINTLLIDLNVLSLIEFSPLYQRQSKSSNKIEPFFKLLEVYMNFPIDDFSGLERTIMEVKAPLIKKLKKLQLIAYQQYKSKLLEFSLSNVGLLTNKMELIENFENLTDNELSEISKKINIRTSYPIKNIPTSRFFLLENIISRITLHKDIFSMVESLSTLPTEQTLYNDSTVVTPYNDGSGEIGLSLPLPKLSLQYLSISDFLYRAFLLHRSEYFSQVKNDIEIVIGRLKPFLALSKKGADAGNTKEKDIGSAHIKSDLLLSPSDNELRFGGFSRMAAKITHPLAILQVSAPKVDAVYPTKVLAEISIQLDTSKGKSIVNEWESLRAGDIVFLVSVMNKQHNTAVDNRNARLGIKHLRSAEVVEVFDNRGYSLGKNSKQSFDDDVDEEYDSSNETQQRDSKRRRRDITLTRKLHLLLDPISYYNDINNTHNHQNHQPIDENIYQNFNLIIRRNQRENNFKPILESVKTLFSSSTVSSINGLKDIRDDLSLGNDAIVPNWFSDIFLGFGNPATVGYKHFIQNFKADEEPFFDFNDTFVDYDHVKESFPEQKIEMMADNSDENMKSPFKLKFDANLSKITIFNYKTPIKGPYDNSQKEIMGQTLRFTPHQIESIISGTINEGLTLVLGPPGTGKTDSAAQIISNLYNNNIHERTLVVTHSNNALNYLFEKLISKDNIDVKHLLRLGHGVDVVTSYEINDFERYGRIETLLAGRDKLLAEVDRLAVSLDAIGGHGNSCETAEYFYQAQVQEIWNDYETNYLNDNANELAIKNFPFKVFFADKFEKFMSQPNNDNTITELDKLKGCYRYIQNIFSQLREIRPFEVIRGGKQRSNFMLGGHSRIVAMTATYAAMKYSEIKKMGIKFDNIIFEECGQLTELETLIPLTLSENSGRDIKRVVMIGDFLQNRPIISNLMIKNYSKVDQSLFERLVKLDCYTIKLDIQGRSRESLVDLWSWRYKDLKNIDINIDTFYGIKNGQNEVFKYGNSGFKNDYQFVDVQDFMGNGETEPNKHFFQNIGEAEYVVAVYQYMRLLGYPKDNITILTMYFGQKILIEEIIYRRCLKNPVLRVIFGSPKAISTVDQYQGEQNDYVLLSLVRTKNLGYLKDLRRLTVGLSRARLGLYVFGRRDLIDSSWELKGFSMKLNSNLSGKQANKLQLSLGEMYGQRTRLSTTEIDPKKVAVIEGVEHMGQYVEQMTKQKLSRMQ
ncbi:P-loop containing nucleoside triphosphate hydrolase protein [Nadsonia fulvescens var. elongata DSM 6958]|uniref:Pre-mRNA-splicing factor n=1 Tax=Nadsonia fulvescens var. elongata DSM 6958 TaxID=857566 RepID=A0A1E3PQS6_9ASCO|nr:P-loop containing nucleoside triphosphate hydrolase protein [Nadsonia fulvescens var. elongata DSM 6958]